jgi:hypothetical protein
MADVTINQLTSQAPTTDDLFPFSTAVSPSTYKASLAQIKTALAIPTAVSQLTNDSGYITSSSLPTSNQLVKAWGVFNGSNNDLTNCSIFSSYNINRVYKRGNGRYTVYFQSALPSKNYAIAGTAQKYDSNDDGNIYVQAGGTTVNVNTTTEFYLDTVTNYNYPTSSGIISFMVVGG